MHKTYNESLSAKQLLTFVKCIVLLLCVCVAIVKPAQANTIDNSINLNTVNKHTIYLVRHAEKLTDNKDPGLTQCGLQRADALAKQLGAVEFTKIYSTNYQRTVLTAMPLAKQNNKKISYYNPTKLKQFAIQLANEQGSSLVVGHSNTTAVLAGLLTQQQLDSFDESIYDRLYQVVIINGHASLQLIMQNFNCTID
ncbi:phosphoglycerate mutase family protein [Thalassomonas sp. M1454]|uniref:phosphoglycerate mutase family protein n=1 Tax=Thalassomonas sp. M1454 TaxID=2594477 RepID=UPI001180B123|nr:phosphoglycerate mutase family protein [Thalassomonas sp. M1454]TRX53091.1 histidine phosphatase family protein [Thalassomonas sp. M1454]